MSNGIAPVNSYQAMGGTRDPDPSTTDLVALTHTVATLPAASVALKGARRWVTDATAPAFMATVAGGGAVFAPVYCDGAAWKVG